MPLIFLFSCIFSGCSRRAADSGDLNPRLIKAVRNGDATQVEQLVRKGAFVGAKDEGGDTALVIAAKQGDHAVASLLLNNSISVRDLDEALLWATMSEPLVKIEAGPEVHVPTAELNPIDENYANVARLLLDKGAGIETRREDGETPLIRAASHGETAVVKLLLDRGAEIEAIDQEGGTALHGAACECAAIDMPDTLDSIKLLVEKGANIEKKNDQGDTPLIIAAGWGRTENVGFLLEKHANIEAKDNDGNTALMISARGSGYPTADTVRFLLDHGSKIDMKNKDGETALMLAASGNGTDQIEIVKLLLERGADVRAKDFHGNTALSLAQEDDHPDVIEGTHTKLIGMLKNALEAAP